MNNFLDIQADEDFSKARSKALINDIQHFLNPEESQLLSFTDVKKMLRPSGEVYQGMQVVPVELIAGSEGRYKDFDNHFFPKNIHLKKRWMSIDKAHLTDVILPPIVLYELGGLYFVRDGMKPGMTVPQMMKQVIHYEKRVFYSETGFGDITDCWNMDFTTPGQYDVIYNHINIHKYYLNQNQTEEIPLEQAILSWYQQVYLPVITVIKNRHIMRRFRNRTPSDLYVWLIKYWDDLKQRFGNDFSLDKAAEDFTKEFGDNIFSYLYKKIKRLFHS